MRKRLMWITMSAICCVFIYLLFKWELNNLPSNVKVAAVTLTLLLICLVLSVVSTCIQCLIYIMIKRRDYKKFLKKEK